jgi:hypothetical protein
MIGGMLLLSVFASTIAFGLWKLVCIVYRQLRSPIRHLPGPKGTSFIYGSVSEVWMAVSRSLLER